MTRPWPGGVRHRARRGRSLGSVMAGPGSASMGPSPSGLRMRPASTRRPRMRGTCVRPPRVLACVRRPIHARDAVG